MDIFSFEGYIFDLDGTLLDSMGLWNDIYVKVLGDFNIKAPSDYLFNVNHMSLCDGAAYTVERFRLEGVVKKKRLQICGLVCRRINMNLPYRLKTVRLIFALLERYGQNARRGNGSLEGALYAVS